MNRKLSLSAQTLQVLTLGLVVSLLILVAVSYKTFGLKSSMSVGHMWDTIKATTDYESILLVNVLIAVSVFLMIHQLRLDALRVVLTVGVALIFGYVMTCFFSLNASKRFIRGDFRVSLLSDAKPLTNINFGDKLTSKLNDPNAAAPVKDVSYRFAGTQGDVVSVLAFAAERQSKLNMQVALLDNDGKVLQENLDATSAQKRTFRRYLQSDGDAAIDSFKLPYTGFYTITAKPEADSADMVADFTVALLSDNTPPVNFAYGADPQGGTFHKEKDPHPLKQAVYKFAGAKGDKVTILAYAAQSSPELNIEVSLKDAKGSVIASNRNASSQQIAAYSQVLKNSKDAVIQDFILPADGIYTIVTQPEPVGTFTKLKEMFLASNNAYNAFLFGPLSRLNRWVIWQRDALTLIMLGLAIAIVFRAEQFSLGAEGQLYFGALVSAVVGLSFGHSVSSTILVPVALLSAATAGFLVGLLPGALKAYLGANELVSTLMLNVVATRFYEMVLTFQLKPPQAGYTSSDWIPANGLLHPIIDINGDQVSIAVYILIALVLLVWLLIQRTPIGYEIRMIGANSKFADYGGINTRRTIMLSMAISGAVAGLAGAHLAMGIYRRLILNISVGLAFEGVVVALLARNNPLVVPFTGLLYAYLRTGAQTMERDTNISAEIVRIIQAVVILLITAEALVSFFQRRRVQRRSTADTSQVGAAQPPAPAQGGANG